MLVTCAWIAAFAVLSDAGARRSGQATLATLWDREFSAGNSHPEYPRPQMARSEWLNLNGRWDYAVRPKEEDRPGSFDGTIPGPFPVESALSGARRRVGPEQRLRYRREVDIPAGWMQKRVLAAAVCTQTRDVEIDVNGLMTYDRAVIKMDPERIAAANRRIHSATRPQGLP